MINQVGHKYKSPRSVNLAARQDRVAVRTQSCRFRNPDLLERLLGLGRLFIKLHKNCVIMEVIRQTEQIETCAGLLDAPTDD